MTWILMAVLSAAFAGLTSILAKCGIKKTDSDLATAIRTIVVLIFSWIMVFIVGSYNTIVDIQLTSLIFLVLSGLATGASWIGYFKALSMGDINKVVPIDKSSTILTVLFSIVFFGEVSYLWINILATVILATGIFLMVEKKKTDKEAQGKSWMIYAIFSAIFAAATSILAKIGMDDIDSNLATAIRTGVVLIMAWIIVFARKKHTGIKEINKKELLFICLSGLATGGSWLCYYYAIQNGIVSVVVPIDKMSILFTVVFSYFVFKEKLSKKALVGLLLMLTATLLMVFFK